MLNSEDIEESSNDSNIEIDDSELDENEDVFIEPEKSLMPELRFEQEISENDIQAVIQKFAQNFAQVYPSSEPVLYMGTLNEAMNHSLFDSIERRTLLLYLHRNRTAATHVFCKNVLCNSEVINYLDKNYLIWPWDCTKDANYQRFLLMLLEHVGSKVTATVAKGFNDRGEEQWSNVENTQGTVSGLIHWGNILGVPAIR
ncbi:unnamed protein product [Rotaria sp. Silwood1]|nr:unnamed protein product [Rotaria sp. Silwood1]